MKVLIKGIEHEVEDLPEPSRIARKIGKWRWRIKRWWRGLLNLPDKAVSKGKFCDYCKCENCQDGEKWLRSIPCVDGTNICDVCYYLDNCDAGCGGGDPEQPCKHKPKIIADPEHTKKDHDRQAGSSD